MTKTITMNKTLLRYSFYKRCLQASILLFNLIALNATAQTYTWKNVTILGGGFIPAIVYSPVSQNLVYCRTDIGGFYRWSAATGAWIPLNDAETNYNLTGGESIAPDPVDSNVVYMAAGMYLSSGNGVILRSANQGTTWTANTIGIPMGGNQNGRGMGERLAVDPNNTQILYFGSRNNGLYKSANAASSWAQVTGFPALGDNGYGLSFVTFDKASGTSGTGSNTIFVGVAAATSTNSNLYVSTNAGSSWSVVTGGPTGMMPSHGVMGSDGNLWLTYTNDYGPYNVRGVTLSGQIWKYNTTSGVWTNVTPPTTNWGGTAGGISVDAQNAQHVVISTLDWYTPDRLLATTDGGTTWNVIAQPPVSYWSTGVSTYNVNGAQYQDANGTELVGTGATNWVQAVAINPFNSNNVMYGTGAGIWASTDAGSAAANGNGAGTTWTFQDQGLEETACLGLVPSVKGAFFSTLGDIEGTRSTSLTVAGTQIGAPYSGNTVGLDFAEKDSAIVAKVTNGTPLVAYSTDNGQTWTACTAPNGTGQDIAVSATGGTFVYAPSSAVASYTTNNGSSWTACTGVPSGARMAADRVNPNYFYATSGGNVYTSSNGGQTFIQTATGVGNNYTSLPRPVFGVEGEFWVASGSALYKVTNHGTTVTNITNVTACNGVGFGMAATGQTHPAVFIIGTVGGTYGFYRSDNNATSWNQTNDSQHQYSAADYCTGDEYVYGRMYVGTNGRGIVYGDIQTATAPPATITVATTTTFCTGGSVVLSANTGTGYTYQWYSGGTAISGATAASYTATTAASYTVKVTSGGLSTTSTATVVTVNTLPTATISNGTTASFCTGGSVTLNANTGTGLTYQWENAGTAISGATAATYAAAAAGTYTIVVKNTNNCSATSTATTVTLNTLPTATISNGATASFCTGVNAVLNANTGTGLTYQWDNGGTAITGATAASYTATVAGTYTVIVTNTNNCSATSTGTTVTVNALPTVTISNGATASFCTGGNVVLTANTGTGLTYQWDNGGTAITGATAASYTATAAGTYTVVVKNTNNCSATSTGTTVTVNALPTATISNGATASFCTGGNVVLTANTGTGLTYQWDNGGTAITGATAASYTATAGGTYTVVVKNANNCSATSTGTTVTINALPTATITPVTTTTFCTGGSVVLNANTGTGLTYQWSNGGTAISGATAASYTATTAGAYTVVVTNANSCSATSTGTTVTVNALPTATITPATTTIFCTGGSVVLNANTGTGLTYQWDNGGTAITGATATNYTATTAGTYTVIVKNTNNCSATSTGTTITVNTLPTATITSAGPTSFCSGNTYSILGPITPPSGTIPTSPSTSGAGAMQIIVYSQVTLDSLSIVQYNWSSGGTANYNVNIYNDNSGIPGTLLFSSTVNTFAQSTSPIIQSLPVNYTFTGNQSGLKYWIEIGGNEFGILNGSGISFPYNNTPGTNIAQITSQLVYSNNQPNQLEAFNLKLSSNSLILNANLGTGLTYQWNNGGSAISGATNSSYTASATSTYTVTVKNSTNCSTTSAATTVTVNSLPTVPTVTSPITYCQNATATVLTAAPSSGGTLNWYTVATGGTASSNAPTPSTTTAGTTSYYVSQTNGSGCESPRAAIAVTVNTIPAAPTVTSPVTNCQSATATALTATPSNGGTLNWYTVATGGTSSSNAPTPSTTTAGTTSYYVSQTITGCEGARATIAVTIQAPPSTSNAGTNQYITSTAASLSANTPALGTGTWTLINGTGIFANTSSSTTSVSGLSQGSNVFEWTISNGSCPSSSSTININVGTTPTAQTITGSANVQDNATGVTYSVPTTSGVSKTWTVPTGATIVSYNSDSSQITVDFGTTSGNVSVNESNDFGNTTSSLFIAVGNNPVQQSISGPVYIANNTSATYSITTPAGVTNHWTIPQGATITASNADSSQVTISFGTNGGTIGVTQTNTFGSTVDSEVISVGNPPVTQTISGPANVATSSTGITYSIPDNAGSTYHWSLPAGATITSASADSNSITISLGTTGGNVSVTETNPYGTATSSLNISVGNAPVTQTISGPANVATDSTGVTYSIPNDAGSSYHWSLPAGATITSANLDSSSITVSFGTTGGTMSVTETNPYGTATSSLSVSVATTTAIVQSAAQYSYQLYPNPFLTTATLRINSPEREAASLSIIDVNGIVLYTTTVYTNENISLGAGISASGIYCVQIICGDYLKVLKLVKND